jgi:hypothetical protein
LTLGDKAMTYTDALILLTGIVVAWWIGWFMGYASGRYKQDEK